MQFSRIGRQFQILLVANHVGSCINKGAVNILFANMLFQIVVAIKKLDFFQHIFQIIGDLRGFVVVVLQQRQALRHLVCQHFKLFE